MQKTLFHQVIHCLQKFKIPNTQSKYPPSTEIEHLGIWVLSLSSELRVEFTSQYSESSSKLWQAFQLVHLFTQIFTQSLSLSLSLTNTHTHSVTVIEISGESLLPPSLSPLSIQVICVQWKNTDMKPFFNWYNMHRELPFNLNV